MPPVLRGCASGLLILAGESLCLLVIGAFTGTSQTHAPAHPAKPAAPVSAIKRRWQTGPADMPLVTEVIPSRGSPTPPSVRGMAPKAKTDAPAPPVVSTLSLHAGINSKDKPMSGHPKTLYPRTPVPGARAAPALPETRITITDESHSVDPERQALSDLTQIRTDSATRQAFYQHLLHTVQQVRAAEGSAASQEAKPAP